MRWHRRRLSVLRARLQRFAARPQLVFDVYKGEFDAAYEDHSLLILMLHPHITAHRSRIQALDRLIAYMKSKPGVWFATLEQVAEYVKAQQSK